MKWYLKITAFAGLLCGCSHLSVTKNILAPDYLLAKGAKQITFQGDNDHPRFSPDGSKLIYSSRARSAHKGAQIYEMDLDKNKERRVTYSDGDAFDPSYLNNAEIIYASTTDEIKENLFTTKNMNKDFPPSDLYMSDRFGGEILRLTQQPGFDAEALYISNPITPTILFTSYRGDIMGVYLLDLKHLAVSLISADREKERHFPAATNRFKQIAFIEKDNKTQEQNLMLFTLRSKKLEILKSGEGLYRDLVFAPRAPTRLFYSILRKGEKQYQIESFDLEKKCTQVVFKGTDSLSSPIVSDDRQERLVFVRNFQDKKQIYMLNLPDDLGPCLETLTAPAAIVPAVASAAPAK